MLHDDGVVRRPRVRKVIVLVEELGVTDCDSQVSPLLLCATTSGLNDSPLFDTERAVSAIGQPSLPRVGKRASRQ